MNPHLDHTCPTCKAPPGEPCRRDRWATYNKQYYPLRSGHYPRLVLGNPERVGAGRFWPVADSDKGVTS
jgi:hypothetical protein